MSFSSVVEENGYVGINYVMNVETEELLFDGTLLWPNMKVLIETDGYRVSIAEALTGMDPEKRVAAERWNRWVTIQRLVNDGLSAEFIGVYDDGNKKKFIVPITCAWYVKKDSLPDRYTTELIYKRSANRK